MVIIVLSPVPMIPLVPLLLTALVILHVLHQPEGSEIKWLAELETPQLLVGFFDHVHFLQLPKRRFEILPPMTQTHIM